MVWYKWWSTSKGEGIPQAFCFPQLFGSVVSYMISLEPSLHSSFLKAAAFVLPLGGEAVTHTVGSAPRYIPVVAQGSLIGHTCVAFPWNCTSQLGWAGLRMVQHRMLGRRKPLWGRTQQWVNTCKCALEAGNTLALYHCRWQCWIRQQKQSGGSAKDHSQREDFLLLLRTWITAISECLKNGLICEITGLVITPVINLSSQGGVLGDWRLTNIIPVLMESERVCVGGREVVL